MKVTVILCTYNRCRALATALESVATSRMPESVDWEVLVIDNNSKDQTREVVEDFIRKYPGRLRHFFEVRQGKSYALNSGIREARGDILAFMDDDVTVEPNWLYELVKPLSDPEWAGTGGRVYLPKDFSPLSWMALEGNHSLVSILALFDFGPETGPLPSLPMATIWHFEKECSRNMADFARTWALPPEARFGMRTQSLAQE